jgi:2-amino-4-hydroxy-6-hydroxymethyldihydropteridine diphosphokinase
MDAWIGLGSNLGDRLAHLRRAAMALASIGRVRARSAVYETAAMLSTPLPLPVEGLPQAQASCPYLNAALWLETALPPGELIGQLLSLETHGGRIRRPGERDAPRTIDLDVLLLGQRGDVVLVSDALIVPHPRLHLRAFALRPLLDLAPALVHPALSLPLHVLYQLLPVESKPAHPLGWL